LAEVAVRTPILEHREPAAAQRADFGSRRRGDPLSHGHTRVVAKVRFRHHLGIVVADTDELAVVGSERSRGPRSMEVTPGAGRFLDIGPQTAYVDEPLVAADTDRASPPTTR
jgi:hypothetical protein